MSAPSLSAASPTARSIRRARLAFAPEYWRHMIAGYVAHSLIVVTALLAISLSSDIASLVWNAVTGEREAPAAQLLWRIARIVLWRSTDLLSELLPIAIFLGVLWSEVALTASGERLAIWSFRRSPMQCVLPVMIFGLALAAVQFPLDAWLRPAAVMALENRPTSSHPDLSFSSSRAWFRSGDRIVHARFSYGPPPRLADVTVYTLNADGTVGEIVNAKEARPDTGGDGWVLTGGWAWSADDRKIDGARRPDGPGDRLSPRRVVAGHMKLAIDPLWLSHFGIHPQYLPQTVLRSLADGRGDYEVARYRVWYFERFARAFLPLAMALLATSLSLALIPYRVGLRNAFTIVIAGYAAHIGNNTAMVLGEYGEIPAQLAPWAIIVLLMAASSAAVVAASRA